MNEDEERARAEVTNRHALDATLKVYGPPDVEFAAAPHSLSTEPDAATPGRYHVLFSMPGIEAPPVAIAALWEAEPGQWRIAPIEGNPVFHAEGLTDDQFVIMADDVAGALAVLARRVRTVKTPQDLLQPGTVVDLMNSQLAALNRHACKAGALPGYASALAVAWGALIADDVREDAQAEHVRAFVALAMLYAERMIVEDSRRVALRALVPMIAEQIREAVTGLSGLSCDSTVTKETKH